MKNKYIKPDIEIIQLTEQEHLMCTSTNKCNNNPHPCGTTCGCGCEPKSKSVIWDDFEEEE